MDISASDAPTVLVVEDEPLIRLSVANLLGQSGFSVLEAANGDEALSLIADRDGICALISDVAMPGTINGFELARTVRREHPRIGIVLVSGAVAPHGGELPQGVCYMSKPIRASTLLRLVRQVADPSAAMPC